MPMIQFDFQKFNEAGMKPVIKAFAKYELKVASVEADNKPRRESGVQVKTATFEFESGQKLFVKAKADGGIVQVKLNSKVLGIKNTDNLDKAVLEIVDYVQGNEKSFLAAKNKVPKIKPPSTETATSTSLADQIDQFQASLDEYISQNAEITSSIGVVQGTVDQKQETLDSINNDIAEEQSRSDVLQSELDQLKASGGL